MKAVRAEFEDNAVVEAAIGAFISRELESLVQNRHAFVPFPRPKTGGWDLIRARPPRRIENDAARLLLIRDYAVNVDFINEMIEGREGFVTVKEALLEEEKFAERLKGIDLWIRDRLEHLKADRTKILECLGPKKRGSPSGSPVPTSTSPKQS